MRAFRRRCHPLATFSVGVAGLRRRRARFRRACGKASSGRSATGARLRTSARDSARWRSESPRPRSPPAAGHGRPRRSAPARRLAGRGGAACGLVAAHRRGSAARRRAHRLRRLVRRGTIAGATMRGAAPRAAGTRSRRSRRRRPAPRRGTPRSRAGAHCRASGCALSRRKRVGRDRADALAFLGGEAREEMPHQIRDVLGPLAQRRHRDREHVQAVEQVLAEAAALHVGDQVAVGRRDDAHVDLDRLACRRPDRPRLPGWRAAASPARPAAVRRPRRGTACRRRLRRTCRCASRSRR